MKYIAASILFYSILFYSILGMYYNRIVLMTLLINNTCPVHKFPTWHSECQYLFVSIHNITLHYSITQMLVVMGTIKAPFEQKHNLSKEQKRENEITVNMPKALDNRSLILLSKRKSFTLALLYFTGNLQWHVNGKKMFVDVLDSLTWTVI